MVIGTSYQFTITSIEERDAGLTLRSWICAVRNVQVVNGEIVGFVVMIPKSNKPAAFARSQNSTKLPPFAFASTLG